MIKLAHLIYCSTATQHFTEDELNSLLAQAREHNSHCNVTGMLLYENGSFFQVLEGAPETIESIFQKICKDERHTKVVTIIHEPLAKRSFSEWTMGYSRVNAQEVGEILGLNDFFEKGHSLNHLDPSRAKKLLIAFKEGRWRARLKGKVKSQTKLSNLSSDSSQKELAKPQFSSSFQPIVNAVTKTTIAYDAITCDLNGRLLSESSLRNQELSSPSFESDSRICAMAIARKLKITCALSFSFRVQHVGNAHTDLTTMLDAADKMQFSPNDIILKVNQDNLIGDPELFARMIQEFRSAGLKLAIDNFGSGKASLMLLETYQPDFISLNPILVSDIDSNGARQAIVRGANQTCQDLGIDIIANYIHRFNEFEWLLDEGIELFQGELFAKAEFEKLPRVYIPKIN